MDIYDKYRIDRETFDWLCIVTVWKHKYSEDSIEQAKAELTKSGTDHEQFGDDFYFDVISSEEKGWEASIRGMFEELKAVGWTYHLPVHYKEKYGKFQLSIETDNEQMHEIVDKYLARINISCMICGDHGEKVGIMGWDSILCTTHYISSCHKIENIDEFGFTVYGERYHWSEIVSVKGYCNYRNDNQIDSFKYLIERVEIEFKNLHPDKEFKTISIHEEYINWYLFLNRMPRSLLSPFLAKYLQNLFETLNDCKVCGMKAVRFSSCIYCNSQTWESKSDKDKVASAVRNIFEDDYIKDEQLGFYSRGAYYEKKKLESFFERKSNHLLLFTDRELIDNKQLYFDYQRRHFDPVSKERFEAYEKNQEMTRNDDKN